MDNKPLNDELLRALAYYGAAGGSGGGGTGTNIYGDLLGLPGLKSLKYPAGVTIKDIKQLTDYGIAEEIQHFFDQKKFQIATVNERMKLGLEDTTNKTSITLDTLNGNISLSKKDTVGNEMSLTFGPDTLGVVGGVQYFYAQAIETFISTDKVVDVANWSATTTTINGIAYFTNELSFTKVCLEHPEVTIISMNNTDILPSKAQRDAYSLVTSSGYFNATRNNNKITCYSQVKPTSSFKIRVKGAK